MPSNPREDDAAEFNRLCDALPLAIGRAIHVLRESFRESPDCMEADADVSRLLARITLITNELK
jgi:hypothetical protein